MKSQAELSNMLTVLAQMVKNMPDDQFSQLVGDNDSGLSRLPRSNERAKHGPKAHISDASSVRMREILLSKLRAATTREEGERILESTFSKKDEWFEFARFLDLPVQRKDSIGRIRHKIVEYTVGSRIDSEVIRGRFGIEYGGR